MDFCRSIAIEYKELDWINLMLSAAVVLACHGVSTAAAAGPTCNVVSGNAGITNPGNAGAPNAGALAGAPNAGADG